MQQKVPDSKAPGYDDVITGACSLSWPLRSFSTHQQRSLASFLVTCHWPAFHAALCGLIIDSHDSRMLPARSVCFPRAPYPQGCGTARARTFQTRAMARPQRFYVPMPAATV